ncbi:substrate-binding domain-containing protein [Leucothrix mucor]|uniref:substrate-binding domain-containing protein n=1 Tax=Leucothrix mucor TaxID=45248 RepID=UPI0003B3B71C|nr:substrate-binding domain-containing protein [Leucothrix mucor]
MNLKQLAQHLKLSPTTVSRALNGYPEVSERTRERVMSAAAQHNYHPSHHATSLAIGKSRAIGHVVPLTEHRMINPHFSDFIAGAGDAYAKAGFDMLLSVVPESEEEAVYRRFAKDGRVDGVIVHGPLVEDSRIELLQSLGLPFVVHGRTLDEESTYSWMDVNNFRAFERATQFLIDLGHQHIGLVNGFEYMNFAARRRDGYFKALRNAGIQHDPELRFSGEMVEPQGYQAVQALIAANKVPTALLFSSILPALGAVRAMHEHNLVPGKDISLIVYDDQLSFLQNSGDIPMFTSLRSSIQDAGSSVAQMLIDMINSNDTQPRNLLWEAELVLGSSTAPPRSL